MAALSLTDSQGVLVAMPTVLSQSLENTLKKGMRECSKHRLANADLWKA